jgi:type I restriction enzyme S subunit
MSVRAPVGSVNLTDQACCIGRGLAAITPKKGIADVWFLFNALKTMERQIAGMGVGSTFTAISKEDMKKIKIPVAPLRLQNQFSDFIKQVDKSRVIAQKAADRYDQLIKSRFIELFGDPISNPMGWKIGQLSNLTTKIGSGATPSGGKTAYNGTEISLVRSMNVHDALFDYDELALITNEQADLLSNVVLQEGDVLLNITGASVARCCVLPSDVLPGRVNQHVCIIRPDPTVLNSIFLNHMLISNSFKKYLLDKSKANGATREAITKEMILKLSIYLPPLEKQNAFALFVEKVNKSRFIDLFDERCKFVLLLYRWHRYFDGIECFLRKMSHCTSVNLR